MARSHVEVMGLRFEAERLVRSGESRAEVARLLGVHPQTLAGWALQDGWRKKDLDLERSGAITRRVIRNVSAARDWENRKRALLEAREQAMREAIGLIAAGDGAGLARLLAGMREDEVRARPALETGPVADPMLDGVRPLGDAPVPEARDFDPDGGEGE